MRQMFDEIQLNFEFGAVRKILCSSHSHSQRRVPFALVSSPPSRPRCPNDASQKRFSLFSDWIQKVQKCGNLVDLVKSFFFERMSPARWGPPDGCPPAWAARNVISAKKKWKSKCTKIALP